MTDEPPGTPDGPLAGIRVIEAATMIAGPTVGQLLSDFGADVIKIEHPVHGDALRSHGLRKDGDSMWWKMIGRNKRCLGLDLGEPAGARLLLRLVTQADVLIEGFRPGTMERYGLGWEQLRAANSGLILLRMTGFGQTGPYARRPAFGTLIEAMSGFAHLTGQPDGPPTLPPFGLADSIAGMSGFGAVLTALYARDVSGGGGQVIDLSILETMAATLGAESIGYDQLGVVNRRSGNRSASNAPRNTYLTRDGRWVALSSSATSIAERLMRLIGHPEVIDEPWFPKGYLRAAHADLLDGYVQEWIGVRTLDEVIAAFDREGIAGSPVYDIAQLVEDPHTREREIFIPVPDDELGRARMPNVLFRLSGTPGRVRHSGKAFGSHTHDILMNELELSEEEIAELARQGVIA